MPSESSSESDYTEITKVSHVARRQKRRRTVKSEDEAQSLIEFPVDELLSVLQLNYGREEGTFDQLIEPLLPSFLAVRTQVENDSTELDDSGNFTRPLRPAEYGSFVEELSKKENLSSHEALILRKLKLAKQRNVTHVSEPRILAPESDLTPLPMDAKSPVPVNPEVLEALYNIETTPFASSFLSRLHGTRAGLPSGVIAVDWESRTPWMNLMADIREHYAFSHPEREPPVEEEAPITYSTLHAYHISQVNDLLERSFWMGIDVSDALEYLPERTTVVAMYKKLVVGIAIIMSPIQTYITYFAVKAGWDKAQIARTMLFHLISMHPDKDFTLHVSTNNSAMLLYNQFGFKAEEFVAGFYSCYLDPSSRASKNAYRLRLRHI